MDNISVRTSSPITKSRNVTASSQHTNSNNKQKKSKMKILAILSGVVVFVGLLVGGWFLYQSSVGSRIDGSKYQAVFFTNGQVYFGKLQKLNGGYFSLNNIYYLQTDSSTKNNSQNPQETSSQQASNVQLIKLGSEVHGPDDEMILSREQILFFENLKNDGKVTKSIAEYQKQKN